MLTKENKVSPKLYILLVAIIVVIIVLIYVFFIKTNSYANGASSSSKSENLMETNSTINSLNESRKYYE